MTNWNDQRNASKERNLFPTGKPIAHLLSHVMQRIRSDFQQRPDWIIDSWKEIIGPRLAPMTEAVSFSEGFLTVKVKNSILLSLLSSQVEREALLSSLRKRFPSVSIRGIHFRIG